MAKNPELDYPASPLLEVHPSTREAIQTLAEVAVEEALEEAHWDGNDELRREKGFYTSSLRDILTARHRELEEEIARLAALTEDAMRAESAIASALSSLDREAK